MKRILCLLLVLCMCLYFCACGETVRKEPVETWEFTDSCGRTVDVPVEIENIVPSGPLAQIVLYTLCPDKLQSLSAALTRVQKQYIDEKYWELPVTGQFYGGSSTVNFEQIAAANPDIIIDIGQSKDGIADDLNHLQSTTGIPVLFIEANIDNMAEAYETLGKICGAEEQAEKCAKYIRDTLADAAHAAGLLPESERKRVLYSQGEYGTEVLGVGSLHAEVLDYACAVNVAEVSSVASKGGNEVSMDQILLWDPDVVILSPDANYDEVFDDAVWKCCRAVENGEVYEVPEHPYNWLDRPPSVQRILGIKWLGNLLYPELFDYDMVAETREFYSLFYHYELSESEARELMKNSTYK